MTTTIAIGVNGDTQNSTRRKHSPDAKRNQSKKH